MPPRAMWTGQLRLSLVSFGVRLYAATESSRKVAMNQLHKDCHQRLRNQIVCPTHGPVTREEIVKGYEYEKDTYVIILPDELTALKLTSTKTVDMVQFVDPEEIDPLYVNSPYFLGPDGPVAEEPFRVIREAMRRMKKIGIGKLVLQGREQIVAIKPSGKGFLLSTLRYAAEVRKADEIFADIKEGDVDDEQLKLAETIMDSKTEPFDPTAFEDKYKDAFFDLVKTKLAGAEPVVVSEDEAPQAFNFMEALQESVAKAGAKKKPARKSVSEKDETEAATTKKKRSRKQA